MKNKNIWADDLASLKEKFRKKACSIKISIEVKSTKLANDSHLKGLRRFKEEYSIRRSILVSLDFNPRRTEDNIEILPWNIFLEQLWEGQVI